MMARFTLPPGDRISNSARTARSEVTVLHADQSRTQKSQANETFSEVFYFRYFPFPVEREALFSQAFRLTIRAAGKLIDEFLHSL